MQEMKINENIGTTIDFVKLENQSLEITGMVQNIRVLGWGAFLILRTPSYTIQTVIDKSKVSFEIEKIAVESCVKITGTVKKSNIKDKALFPRDFEIQVTGISIISVPSVSPLPVDTTKKDLNAGLNTKFDLRPLTLRHPRERAIFKIAACICNEFSNYLTGVDFTRICSPKIVFSGAEGGANIFKLGYFEKTAFLAQSPQFYKQMMVGVFGRVYEIGPVFRAEEHDTSRHLNEYISLDFEMGFINSFYDIINVEANMLRSIINKLKIQCKNEIELLETTLPDFEKIITLEISEVHEIIFKNYNIDCRSEPDLSPEEEKLICEYSKKEYNSEFVFVTHYPTKKRPFYAMEDPKDPEKTLSFDLLFRGLEITTGGQRLHKYEDYIVKMKKLNMNIDSFESYLQTFKFGMPPHGGLGLGLERLTAQLCNLANVKEASLFPRDINRLEP